MTDIQETEVYCVICGMGTGVFTDPRQATNDPRCAGCRNLPEPGTNEIPYTWMQRAQRELPPDAGVSEIAALARQLQQREQDRLERIIQNQNQMEQQQPQYVMDGTPRMHMQDPPTMVPLELYPYPYPVCEECGGVVFVVTRAATIVEHQTMMVNTVNMHQSGDPPDTMFLGDDFMACGEPEVIDQGIRSIFCNGCGRPYNGPYEVC